MYSNLYVEDPKRCHCSIAAVAAFFIAAMFDGQHKSHRQVRLSGKLKKEERNDTLERARIERNERALERSRNRAVVRIQSCWRSFDSRQSIKDTIHARVSKKLHDVMKLRQILLASSTEFLIPLNLLVELLREFLFVYNDPRTPLRLQTQSPHPIQSQQSTKQQKQLQQRRDLMDIGRIFYDNIKNGNHESNYLALSKSLDRIKAVNWYQQTFQLLQHMMTCLFNNAIEGSTDSQEVTLFVQLMELILSSPHTESVALQQIAVLLTAKKYPTTLNVLGGCLTFLPSSFSQPTIECFIHILLKALDSTLNMETSPVLLEKLYRQFLSSIFVIPSIMKDNRMSNVIIKVVTSSTVWRNILIAQNDFSELSPQCKLFLLGNLLEIGFAFPLCGTWIEGYAAILAILVTSSPLEVAFEVTPLLSSTFHEKDTNYHEEKDFEEEGEIHGESLFTIDPKWISNFRKTHQVNVDLEIPSSIRNQLFLLIKRSYISNLFGFLLGSLETATPALVPCVGHLCKIYSHLVLHFGGVLSSKPSQVTVGQAAEILSILVFSSSHHKWLWILWRFFLLAVDLKDFSSSFAIATHPHATSILFLFCSAYSHLLLVMDDETFHQSKDHFSRKELVEITNFLKQFLYTIYSAGQPQGLDLQGTALILAATRLFNQLYDRNCRRSYCSAEEWHWPSLVTSPTDLSDFFEGKSTHFVQTVLTLPQVFPFHQRTNIFCSLLERDKASIIGRERINFDDFQRIRIRREFIFEDSLFAFQNIKRISGVSGLKSRIQVTFVNEQGLVEAGVDGGGLFKEFLESLTKQAFDPQYSLLLVTSDQLLYPNPFSNVAIGNILGKTIYEGILIEPLFASFFLNKILGKYNNIDDLRSLDPELYKNLMFLKQYDGKMEDLSLNFTITENEYGQAYTRELCPNGHHESVTSENLFKYIHLMANYKLNIQISAQCRAFLRGFSDLIPEKWSRLFNPDELQMVIGGSQRTVDVDDWANHTVYSGGYHPSQPLIIWFWEVVREFSSDEKASLLKFITSCSRQPLLGFNALNPHICIQQVRIEDDTRLPSSSTCMNLLKLPTYSSKLILKRKLEYAIHSNAGFELS